MEPSSYWWLATAAAIVTELLTGTFYLLMVAIGLVVGALAAHAGLDTTWQLALAAVVSAATVAGLQMRRNRQASQGAPAHANPDINLDIGQTVQVQSWQTPTQGHAQYRGAQWTVELLPEFAGPSTPAAGAYLIAEVQGSWLRVRPAQANPTH